MIYCLLCNNYDFFAGPGRRGAPIARPGQLLCKDGRGFCREPFHYHLKYFIVVFGQRNVYLITGFGRARPAILAAILCSGRERGAGFRTAIILGG